jgi:inorganic pyrophosphatase
MDEPAVPGCLLKCRPIGIIARSVSSKQGTNRKAERNDRIVAIEQENHTYARVKKRGDLGKKFVRELEEFFVNHHGLMSEKYRILGIAGTGEARRRIQEKCGVRPGSKADATVSCILGVSKMRTCMATFRIRPESCFCSST